jgi:hypothetical protein
MPSSSPECQSPDRAIIVAASSPMNKDALQSEQAGRVALGLLSRLAPCYDDEEAWRRLPDEFPVYVAGGDGLSWTTSRETAESLARMHGLDPTREGRVAKQDVLAYITERGEDEIIPRPGSVVAA